MATPASAYTPKWRLNDNGCYATADGKYLGVAVRLEAFKVGTPAERYHEEDGDDDDDDNSDDDDGGAAYLGTEVGLDRLNTLCPYGYEEQRGSEVRGLPEGKWLLFVRP